MRKSTDRQCVVTLRSRPKGGISKGEYEVFLEPFDVISVPIGAMRAIRNVSDSDVWHLTILGGAKPSRQEV